MNIACRPLPWIVALGLLTASCASTGATPKPFPVPSSAAAANPKLGADGLVTADVTALVDLALGLRGTPYRNGGSEPSGFDCSGLTQWVFAKQGVGLPRDVAAQFELGHGIELRRARPGDLIFFATTSKSASHVGLVIGADQFVHAPSSRGVVRVESYRGAYWAKRVVGVRRVVRDRTDGP